MMDDERWCTWLAKTASLARGWESPESRASWQLQMIRIRVATVHP